MFVATGPLAEKFFRRGIGIALATFPRGAFCGLALDNTRPVAARLLTSSLFALRTGTISTVRRPLSPATGGRLALGAAVAAQGVGRMKSPFATLQQTETPSSLTGTVLHLGRFSIIFKLGHGESLLPDGQVSLRSVNFAARRLLKLPDLLPGRHRSFQHNQSPFKSTIESAIKPSRIQPATPPKRPSHKPLPTPPKASLAW